MTRRWIGGVFGNTVGSDTDLANTTGVFSMEQQYFMKQEGGWTPPIGTESNPYSSWSRYKNRIVLQTPLHT